MILTHKDFDLFLWKQRFLNLRFETSEEERFEDTVKPLDQGIITKTRVGIEPFIKILYK